MNSHPPEIDVRANRRAQKWSARELAARLVWDFLQPVLFRWTPRQMWGVRRIVLRGFGATIGCDVHIYPTVKIAIPWTLSIGNHAAIGDGAILYGLGEIRIGARATVSQYAHLCAGTHDYRRQDLPLVKEPIVIGHDAWICADAFIGPGVTIGSSAVVGARAVVMRDVQPGTVVAGNPANVVRRREEGANT